MQFVSVEKVIQHKFLMFVKIVKKKLKEDEQSDIFVMIVFHVTY